MVKEIERKKGREREKGIGGSRKIDKENKTKEYEHFYKK